MRFLNTLLSLPLALLLACGGSDERSLLSWQHIMNSGDNVKALDDAVVVELGPYGSVWFTRDVRTSGVHWATIAADVEAPKCGQYGPLWVAVSTGAKDKRERLISTALRAKSPVSPSWPWFSYQVVAMNSTPTPCRLTIRDLITFEE